ncbi:alcohol dehydrogenase catalytic domain-containing protein [Gulosibacter sp. 10]|uniref:alcohol dehydrogenase catalytic domain-containing protein n=1 Tax=Gulosibacter sp. 10 TaxID=1255570 RepID=UPI00097E9D9B|nr:alcohol dehydrogenase catalytic domain-containing protein [Gulosibacter sp. 10]SJM55551.1 L-idonate 5-dehydrogenase [Gulosibacter sp. 10]
MHAVIANPGGGLELRERDALPPGPGQVRIRVVYGGICGSDLHYAQSGRNGIYAIEEPLVLGHEIVGIVDELGPGATGAAVGDRVAVHPATPTPPPGGEEGRGLHLAHGGTYLGSASTSPHTQGGFAEYATVGLAQLRPLPEGLPLRRAALAEPLAVALHGIGQAGVALAGGRVDGRVLVAGAGPIGCLAIAALAERGATDITATDLVPRALGAARAVGAARTVLLGEDELPGAESFDLVIESSGSIRSLASALDWVRRGGTIVQLGLLPAGPLTLPLAPMVSKEVTLRGSQRFDVELDEAIRLLARDDRFDAIVSDVYPAADAEEAFAVAADSSRSSKVLLQFAEDPGER